MDVDPVGFDRFPKQGSFLGRRVEVCFDFDPSRVIGGKVIREDTEAPGVMLIHLDDDRIVRSAECQYSLPRPKPPATTLLDQVLSDRRLDREDFEIQVEAARKSVERGHFAAAKAELNGARLVLEAMEKRAGG